jgi:hypothetical protein
MMGIAVDMNGSRCIGVKRMIRVALLGAAVCARGADAAVEGSIFVEKWDEVLRPEYGSAQRRLHAA